MPRISIEGAVGITMGILLLVLDKMGIGGLPVYGVLFCLAAILCFDSVIRSEWATSDTSRQTSRRFGGGAVVGIVFVVLGIWIFRFHVLPQEKHLAEETERRGSELTKEPSRIGKSNPTPPPAASNTKEIVEEAISEYNKRNPNKALTQSQIRETVAAVLSERNAGNGETDTQLSNDAAGVLITLRRQKEIWLVNRQMIEHSTEELIYQTQKEGPNGKPRPLNAEEIAPIRAERKAFMAKRDKEFVKGIQPVVNEMCELGTAIYGRLKPYEQIGGRDFRRNGTFCTQLKTDTYGPEELRDALSSFATLQRMFAKDRNFQEVQ